MGKRALVCSRCQLIAIYRFGDEQSREPNRWRRRVLENYFQPLSGFLASISFCPFLCRYRNPFVLLYRGHIASMASQKDETVENPMERAPE
jgi:hypothetical protein